jgi:tetratricopeptide (TPR) repeat protein/transcriptional regulator with XRE-family HTH domain
VRLENSGEDWSTPKRRVAAELTSAVLRAERRLGRGLDRTALAKCLNVSPASMYAYLKGTTLPRGPIFERLLDELGVTGVERGWLTTLRDAAEVAYRVAPDKRANQAAPSKPCQLPPDTRHFVGRVNELARLVEIASTPNAGAARVCVIEGTAGVGKTTLATRAGHRVKGLFPDGHLYTDLRGFAATPPVDAAEALLGFLHALGAPSGGIPPALADRVGLYRSLLDGQRVLVVLDNAGSSEQVRPLVPPAPGCLLVVTGRGRMDSLVAREGAVRIPLAVLTLRDAVELLAARVGAARLAAEPDAVRDLVDLCAGLPLALSVVASRLADRPEEPLSELVAELRDTDDRLEPLSSSDTDLDLRTVFRWSYDALTPPAARLFRLMGLHPGPDVGLAACAALADTSKPPRPVLRELASANLLIEQSRGRFRLHDLLHAYARSRALQEDPAEERMEAVRRMLDHYLGAASAANARIQPNDAEDRSDVRPAPGTYADAMAWFTAEHEVLLALAGYAAVHGFESHAWRLAWACMVFLRRSSRNAARIDVQRIAVSAARRVGDRAALAASRRMLADALARSRRAAEVRSLLAAALAAFEDLGDSKGALRTHLSFVRALDAEGDHTRALGHAEAALRLAEADGDRPMLADALAATARQLTHLDQMAIALDRCARALEIYSSTGNTEGKASVLKIVGDAELSCGCPQRAITAYERSLALDRALGDRYWEAHALNRLATAHRRLGDPHTADRLHAEAVAALELLHHPDVAVLRR